MNKVYSSFINLFFNLFNNYISFYNNISYISLMYSFDIRLMMLKKYYVNKMNIADICKMFNVSLKTFYNWRKRYSNNKFMNDIKKSDLANIDMTKPRKQNTTMLTDDIKKIICGYIIDNSKFNVKKFLKILSDANNINISKSTFYNWLNKMGLTYKKARKKILVNIKTLLKKRKVMKTYIDTANKKNEPIISIDEFSIKTSMCNSYGWNYTGKPVDFRIKKNGYERFSVLVAINKKR